MSRHVFHKTRPLTAPVPLAHNTQAPYRGAGSQHLSSQFDHVHAASAAGLGADELLALDVIRARMAPLADGAPLPREIVWMPAGTHEITAHGADGKPWKGTVVCDESGARSVAQSFARILAAGRRVRLDEAHEGDAATAWVTGFSWDPARGIIAAVEWTSLGEELVRGKVYTSFSPEFLVNKTTKRVAAIWPGRPAGGLVNEPAFGAAMPALIAARLAGAESTATTASDGPSDNQKTNTMLKELLIQILAALAVQAPADATDEQLITLFAKHKDQLVSAAKTNAELQSKLTQLESVQAKAKADADELVQLRAHDAQRRKDDAKKAVDAAVARGALPPKDEAIQAKWLGLIEADPSHATLLAAMPDNPALTRVTSPGITVQAKDNLLPVLQGLDKEKDHVARGTIVAREISPLFAKDAAFGRELGLVLAAHSLGTLSSELVLQRSLSLLRLEYPFLFEISTDYTGENAAYGQSVKTRLKGTLTANAYNASTGYGSNDVTMNDVDVVINQHFGVPVTFNVNQLASTARDLFGEQAESMHSALADKVVDALFALITAEKFTHYTAVALENFKRKTMNTIARKFYQRKIPGTGRISLLSPTFYEQIMDDSVLINLATQQRGDLIANYQVPPIAGFKPHQAVSLPTTGDLAGFNCTARALALATRLPSDYTQALPGVPSNGIVRPVFNAETGITVQQVQFVDHNLATATSRVALMFGVAVGDPVCGERIVETEGGDESS